MTNETNERASKRALLADLLPLMAANGTDRALLTTMQEPEWLEKVSVENLEFLLEQQRALQALRKQNEGVYERWQRAREERKPLT